MANQTQSQASTDQPPVMAASGTAPPVQESSDSIQKEMTEIEKLTHELKKLLVGYESTLEEEGIRQQVETLERWLEAYRHGLSAAHKISEKGAGWLMDLRSKMKLAADELQRLESEGGGSPPSKEQAAEAEELLKAIKSIDELLPDIEELFCRKEGQEEDADNHCLT